MEPDRNDDGSAARPSQKMAPLGRDKLARLVVVGSFLTLFMLAGALVSFATHGSTDGAAAAAEKAFNAILPVLAGWVGTVLAFYFSSANQESILESTIGRGPGKLPPASEAVSTKMIAALSIFGTQDLKKVAPETIRISDLRKTFSEPLPNNAKVTRLFFTENGVFKYVLHSSTLNAYIADVGPSAADSGTLADLLKIQKIVDEISKLVVFVAGKATVGDAKKALDRVSGAQDVIVTATGNATEPMLGWMSNVDLTKALQVA
jgi:hypothetical protein